MFKKIMDFNTIILMSLSIIVHFFRMIYLLFKPRFMSKYEFFANYTVSKSQLSVYYLLSILVSYWIILKKIQKLRIYYYAFLSDCYSFNSFFTQIQLLDKSYQKKIKCIKRSYFYFNIHISSMYLSTICKQDLKKTWIDDFVALRRHPTDSLLPKLFKKMLRILLAFLLLIGLRKRAFDTASH